MLGKLFSIILILFLPIIIIFGTLISTAVNEDFYDKELEKINIYEEVSKENTQIIKNEVLDFLKDDKQIETNLLKEKEKQHMEDVKKILSMTTLFIYALIALFIIGIIILIITKNYKKICSIFLIGSLITIITNLIIYMLSKFMFSELFTLIHKIIYTNNLWMLNPQTDNLIKIFSEKFFIDFTARVILISSGIAFILLILFYIIKRILDKFKHEEYAEY